MQSWLQSALELLALADALCLRLRFAADVFQVVKRAAQLQLADDLGTQDLEGTFLVL
jgi:hypothetical protein